MTKRTRRIDSGGVRLTVHERGDSSRPTVLLVHGYPDTSGVWDGVAGELAEHYHVVSYDVRGAGESDRPRRRADYLLPILSQDVRSVADAVCPDRPVHLVGHDWGSVQAWEAVTEPDAPRRFASYTSTSGPSLDHMGHWLRAKRRSPRELPMLLRQLAKSWYIAMFHLPLIGPIAWRAGLAKAFPAAIARSEGIPPAPDYPAPTLARDGARGIQLYRANIVPRLRRPGERPTSVPVQVIVPLRDRYLSPATARAAMPWVERLWIREVWTGHWLPRKAPAAMAHAIRDLVEYAETGDEVRSLRRWRADTSAAAEFANRLVVVTGAGSGIGRETAVAFASLGAVVIAADIDATAAAATTRLLTDTGGVGHPYEVDVADVDAMERFAAWVLANHQVPDVVVNNAGIGIAGPFLATSAADWQRIVDINVLGVTHGCRLFGAAMAARHEGGHIVNVASAAAFTPSRSPSAYAASKAAVLMLSECLRAELAADGIGVSAICPGIVNTPITTSTRYVGLSDSAEADRRQRVAAQYARRNYSPAKVAAAIVTAVRTNAAVVPVAPEAVIARWLSRLSPAAMRRLAKLDVP